MKRSSRRLAGLTLIESAVLFCVVGVLLAAFIPSFVRQVRSSKISEATTQLASIYARTVMYYDATHETPGGRRRRCFPPPAGPTPATPSVDAVEVDFISEEEPGRLTWMALGFMPTTPLRFRYTFIPSQDGCGVAADDEASAITIRAEGDLDGDGRMSTFERAARIERVGGLKPFGVLSVENRVE